MQDGTETLIEELRNRGEAGDLLAAILAERIDEAYTDFLYSQPMMHAGGHHLANYRRYLQILNDAHAIGICLLIARDKAKGGMQ